MNSSHGVAAPVPRIPYDEQAQRSSLSSQTSSTAGADSSHSGASAAGSTGDAGTSANAAGHTGVFSSDATHSATGAASSAGDGTAGAPTVAFTAETAEGVLMGVVSPTGPEFPSAPVLAEPYQISVDVNSLSDGNFMLHGSDGTVMQFDKLENDALSPFFRGGFVQVPDGAADLDGPMQYGSSAVPGATVGPPPAGEHGGPTTIATAGGPELGSSSSSSQQTTVLAAANRGAESGGSHFSGMLAPVPGIAELALYGGAQGACVGILVSLCLELSLFVAQHQDPEKLKQQVLTRMKVSGARGGFVGSLYGIFSGCAHQAIHVSAIVSLAEAVAGFYCSEQDQLQNAAVRGGSTLAASGTAFFVAKLFLGLSSGLTTAVISALASMLVAKGVGDQGTCWLAGRERIRETRKALLVLFEEDGYGLEMLLFGGGGSGGAGEGGVAGGEKRKGSSSTVLCVATIPPQTCGPTTSSTLEPENGVDPVCFVRSEVKKAYRKQAKLRHPDKQHSPPGTGPPTPRDRTPASTAPPTPRDRTPAPSREKSTAGRASRESAGRASRSHNIVLNDTTTGAAATPPTRAKDSPHQLALGSGLSDDFLALRSAYLYVVGLSDEVLIDLILFFRAEYALLGRLEEQEEEFLGGLRKSWFGKAYFGGEEEEGGAGTHMIWSDDPFEAVERRYVLRKLGEASGRAIRWCNRAHAFFLKKWVGRMIGEDEEVGIHCVFFT